MEIVKRISNNKNHYGVGNGKKFITIHDTGNKSKGANAMAHSNFINNGSKSTWHYTVDEKQIIQHFDDSIRCWHSGDGRGNGNMNSIGIEMCINSDGNFNKTIENTIELVKYLMSKYNIPINNIVQHNKWSGKNCPSSIRSGKPIDWSTFKNKLISEPTGLYRVQVGAYKDKQNAIDMSNKLKKDGYNNFITFGK